MCIKWCRNFPNCKTDEKILTEYDIATNKEKIRMQTTYPVYTFFMDKNNNCVVIEKRIVIIISKSLTGHIRLAFM